MLVPDGRQLDLYEVFLRSGNFIPIKTDLHVPDFMPLAFTRAHVAGSLARREHRYFRDVYEPHFYWGSEPYKFLEWYLPDGISIKYERNPPGAPDEHPIWSQVHYDTDAPFPLFKGSRANWTGSAWDVSLQDGTTYLLEGERGSLVGIFDKDGNEIRLARKPTGDLTQITSPNGSWIRFSQDDGLIFRAADNMGNAVNYIYDERHRLKRVTDSRGESTEYEYNLFNHIARMTDSRGSNSLEISYEPHDRDDKVIQLSLPDGSKFQIDYFLDKETRAGHVDITDPKRKITRVTMNPNPGENAPFYTVEKVARNSPPGRQR
jgi:YD repeat-containing protein